MDIDDAEAWKPDLVTSVLLDLGASSQVTGQCYERVEVADIGEDGTIYK